MSGLGHVLSCTFLPTCCSLCGCLLPEVSAAPVCAACWGEVPAQRATCCERCGEDLFEPALANPANLCRPCRMAPPAFERAVSFGVYEGSMRGAIHALKYERMTPLVRQLGLRLAAAIQQLDVPRQEMLVVPVPLHRGRLSQRGFNQARGLAVEALRILKRSHPEWKLELAPKTLVRQRSTESQAGLTPRQRRLNLRGAFFVSEVETIRGRRILLVDDIYTTGATARACSRTLIEAGAAAVYVATVARAQRRVPLGFRGDGSYTGVTTDDSAVTPAASKKTAVQ